MSPDQLVQELVLAGGRVQWTKAGAKLVGRIPDAVVLEIKDQRDAFLAAWDRHETGERAMRGWGALPRRELPLRTAPPKWTHAGYQRMDAWGRRQPRDVVLWILKRSEQYGVRKEWAMKQQVMAAIADLWDCQMGVTDRSADQVIAGCEEAFEGRKR